VAIKRPARFNVKNLGILVIQRIAYSVCFSEHTAVIYSHRVKGLLFVLETLYFFLWDSNWEQS